MYTHAKHGWIYFVYRYPFHVYKYYILGIFNERGNVFRRPSRFGGCETLLPNGDQYVRPLTRTPRRGCTLSTRFAQPWLATGRVVFGDLSLFGGAVVLTSIQNYLCSAGVASCATAKEDDCDSLDTRGITPTSCTYLSQDLF